MFFSFAGMRGLCTGLGPAVFGFIFYLFHVNLNDEATKTAGSSTISPHFANGSAFITETSSANHTIGVRSDSELFSVPFLVQSEACSHLDFETDPYEKLQDYLIIDCFFVARARSTLRVRSVDGSGSLGGGHVHTGKLSAHLSIAPRCGRTVSFRVRATLQRITFKKVSFEMSFGYAIKILTMSEK